MMKDVIIKIDQNSMVYKQETVLGISYENLQGKIIFKFLGTFPKGIAYLEYERDTEKGYLQMNQVGEEYQLEIKSSLLTKEGRIYFQLRVTEDATPEGIPVFKSNKFYLEVKEAINATAEIPDEYPEWIDAANEKIKEMDNLNITTERVEDGVDIILTDKKGNTTRTEVKDGAPGPVGPQGAPGAVKMQVVDTLPETGETDTIYLVKKSNPGEQNLYDEYVYANGAWEHIGDTSVDLTDYYTKNETDNKIFESIPILYNSTSPNDSSHSEFDLNAASRVITTLYKTGGKFFIYRNTTFNVPDVLIAMPSKITQITRQYGYGCYNSTGNSFGISVKGLNCIMEGTWNNDTFTCKYVQFTFSKQSLEPATNTITSTSTAPVQGNVIKKYVDDNIKTYTAGDGIEISEDNVISAKGGESIYEIRPSNLSLINFMDKALVGEQITKMFTDGVEDPILRVRPTSANNVSINYYDFKLGRKYYPFSKKTGYYFMINPIIDIYGSPIQPWNTHLQIPYIYIYGSWDSDNKFTCTAIKYNEVFDERVEDITTDNKVLTKTNTTTYTPTGDYNPATKKYVDDQVGNINTVLATLTTVSEVTK